MVDQLVRLAAIWAEKNDRSVARLSTLVANDGGLFPRLEAGGRLTTDTFEKFLSFFRDGGNWRDQQVPQEAADLLDNFENIATAVTASSGNAGDVTASAEQAA